MIAARYEKDGESCTGSDCGDKLADVHLSINSSDDMETVTLTGEIFTDSGSGRVTAYCNPVYQQEDGRIYLVPGEGMTADSGGSMAFNLSESRESAVEGEPGLRHGDHADSDGPLSLRQARRAALFRGRRAHGPRGVRARGHARGDSSRRRGLGRV